MGVLVELFCEVFALVCKAAEKRGQKEPGCLAVTAALVISALVTYMLVQVIVWITAR